MKIFHLSLALAAALFCTQGFAATAQQNKMTACNADATAKSLKGDDRKAYMSSCLKATPAGTPQQQKMKTCNATATSQSLKGDARKTYMSTCLKKS
ncbi:PsiF family protein [Pseudomonas sp. dw_358]|uniref:PsiF family protein n=1 Tax=Pseudomonas sp. dw_358 TaxID=2720083 RepID=UPI001BD1D4C0|nr:PsiF family protein [Pseudomonas sp. dw_358]